MKLSSCLVVTVLGVSAVIKSAMAFADETKVSPTDIPKMAFSFDSKTKKSFVSLTHSPIYTDQQGYGFDLNTDSKKPPYYFSVKLPEGNYKVTLKMGGKQNASNTTVKAESRRLYINNLDIPKGKSLSKSFIVNTRTANLKSPENLAPGLFKVALKEREKTTLNWDDKITLEINGKNPSIQEISIEQIDVPTIYLVGDSTVTDQPYEPAASWGQMLTNFFDDRIAIANHAESGETLKSFISEGRFAKVLDTLKAGDYLFIQFGHNDQKKQWPQTYVEAKSTYKDYLKVYIDEAKLRGANPVLITSTQRRKFDANGKIINTHGDYPSAMKELAATEKIALIDLETMSRILYETLGTDRAKLAFNDNGNDETHHNNYGAFELANSIANELNRQKILHEHLKPAMFSYNPEHPRDPEKQNILTSPVFSNTRPLGN